MHDEKQKRIEEAIANKNVRQDKTSDSILVSWAINNAVNTLSEDEKSGGFNMMREHIETRYPFFIELRDQWFNSQALVKAKETMKGLTDEQLDKIDKDWQEKYNEASGVQEVVEQLPIVNI